MDIHKYVTIEDVADFYSVSVSTVRNWIKTGVIPDHVIFKVGHTHRYKIADIEGAIRGVPASEIKPPLDKEVKAPVQLELDLNPDEDL